MELTQEIIDNLPPYASVFDEERGIIAIDSDACYGECIEELGLKPDQYSVEVARRCLTHDILAVTGPGLHLKIIGSGKYAIKNMPENEEHGPDSAARGAANFMRHYIEMLVKRRTAAGIDSPKGQAIKDQLYRYGVILTDTDTGTTWRRA